MTITDNSTLSAIPLMECMKNDGSLFETKPDLDPTKTLAILPFSSGTTGPPKGKYNLSLDIKFIYSEKATKFCEIFPLLLTAVHTVKSEGKICKIL